MTIDEASFADVEFPIGQYRVLSLLGRGGIGEVFVAHRRGGTQLCALKRLRPEVANKEVAKVRIKREAHLATYLDHPNICRVLDAGYDDDCFFLATEFVHGVDLERIVQALAARHLALAVDMVMAVALPALAGLHHAHVATDPDGRPLSIVHRDLSPRNIMVTFGGEVKLIDFGVAHAQVDDYRTAPGVLVGTPKYLSPEQALGSPVDARSDLYSLAAVIYEMLAGRSVVRGSGNLMETLQQIVSKPPRPVSEYNPAVPKVLEAALERALAKEPEDRYASARDMQDTLRAVAGAPASPAQLGRLVHELFPELAEQMTSLIARAQESVTPAPRPRSVVDPFSATAVSQLPDELQIPTRAGQLEDPLEPTRAVFRAELEQADLQAEALLPTRAAMTVAVAEPAPLERDAALQATFLPTRTAPHPSRSPAPSASAIGPRRRAGPMVAIAAVTVAAVATAAALALGPRPQDAAPRPAADPLSRRLGDRTRALESGGALDPADLAQVVEQVMARAAKTEDEAAQREARSARDCLATCPDQERMLAAMRRALGVVRAAER